MKVKSRGNGQGTAFMRKGAKSWTAQIVIGWRESEDHKKLIPVKKCKSGFKTKKEALAACDQLLAESKHQHTEKKTMQQLFHLWKKSYESRVGKSTMANYYAAYRHFRKLWLFDMNTITAIDLQKCIDECPAGKRTRQVMKVTAGLLWAYAVDGNYAKRDVTSNLYVGKGMSLPRDPLTEDEVERIHSAIGQYRYAEYIYCMCYLGFRPGEMLELKKDQLFFADDNGQRIYYFIAGKKTDAGRNRTVIVPGQIIDLILDRIYIPGTDLIFPMYCFNRTSKHAFTGFKNMTDNYFREHVFKPIMKELKIEGKVPYSARHTYANKLKNAEGDRKDKAALIGHSDYDFTQKQYQTTNLHDLKTVTDSLK